MNNTSELCDFLTQPQVEEQYDAEYESWCQEVSDELDRAAAEFELANSAREPVFMWGPAEVGKSKMVSQVAGRQGWLLTDFRLADNTPGMLEAYPELWARISEVVGCDTEEETLS